MTYALHGLAVASEIPLDAPATDRAPDWVVSVNGSSDPDGPPDGRITSRLETDGVASWLAEREDGSRLLRYRDLAEFEVAGDRIVARPAASLDRGMLPILLGGSVLAHLISAEGGLILHASAVEIDGQAIALFGFSGAGKSTTAARLCSEGAALFTDDALAIESDGRGRIGHRGTDTIRLRPQAAGLAQRIPGAAIEQTADGRTGVRPRLCDSPTLPIGAAVAVELDPEARDVSVEPLSGQEAVMALLKSPRVIGWCDRARQAAFFRGAAGLAQAVPVLRLRLPKATQLDGGDPGGALIEALAPHARLSEFP